MKRIVVFALVLNAALLGVIAHQLVAIAGGGAVATENGDTNGDGARDITDAVYLLQWLFGGGEEPVAFAQEGGGLTPEQAEILEHMSIMQLPIDDEGNTAKTIRFSGVNVQVVDGTGETDFGWRPPGGNGLGNLVVGYQELRTEDGDPKTDDSNDRSGSHNLVVGSRNNYNIWGGQVVGWNNTISGPYSTVSGGRNNTASMFYSTVSGGLGNTASGRTSTVSGGHSNTASGYISTVSGGDRNTASGDLSTVSGGDRNAAIEDESTVSGGKMNTASGPQATVSGGRSNAASGGNSTVSGGLSNAASGDLSTVSGGRVNRASELYSTISGGELNRASVIYSTVSGGNTNWASGVYSTVSGGERNTASGVYSTVSGGVGASASLPRQHIP